MVGLLSQLRWRRIPALPLLSLGLALPLTAQGQATPAVRPPGTPSPDDERILELTIDDVLRIALKNNLTLQIEALRTESAEFDALGSWGAFDPFFNFTGSYDSSDRQGTGALGGGNVIEDDSLGFNTGLNVPFTTGGSLDLTVSHSNVETKNLFGAFDVSTTDVFTVALTQPLLKGAWSRYATTTQRLSRLDFDNQLERC